MEQASGKIITEALRRELGENWNALIEDPAHPGQFSRYGISQASVPDTDLHGMRHDDAVAYYKKGYWDPLHADEIGSQRIAATLFQAALKTGTKRAAQLAQQALDIAADGIIGPQTLRAINAAAEDAFLSRFESLFKAHLSQAFQRAKFDDKIAQAALNSVNFPANNADNVGVGKVNTPPPEMEQTEDIMASAQARAGENFADLRKNSAGNSTEQTSPNNQAQQHAQQQSAATPTDLQFDLEAVPKESSSDFWTIKDQLGYEKYAHAIAKLIIDGRAQAPLTISVQAPWGQGKTSLMNMIKDKLEYGLAAQYKNADKTQGQGSLQEVQVDAQTSDDTAQASDLPGVQSQLPNIWNWIRGEKDAPDHLLKAPSGTVPCIWFNPLYYQNSDQVWSGLAHTLLYQLAEKLPAALDRERFWFRLRLARLNTHAIRRDMHKLILERVLPKGLVWAALLLGLLLEPYYFGNTKLTALLTQYPALNALPVLGGMLHLWLTKNKDLALDDKLMTYVSEPDYESNLGLLHLVDQDIDRALQLMLGKDGKLVIFIDDLDRCEPQVVNDIMIAINQFISVSDRNIIFILGMDTHMVAMAIEAAAEKQAETYNKNRHTSKGYGWRFMEKFVQLPFFIPRLDETGAKGFMHKLLGVKPATVTSAEELDRINSQIVNATTMGELKAALDSAVNVDEQSRARIETKVAEKVIDLTTKEDNETLQRLVSAAIDDLHYNPREIKRFLNVARLLFLNFENEAKAGSHEHMLKVVRASHLLLNWPQCLRWLQGNAHSFNVRGEKLDPVVSLSSIMSQNNAQDFASWCKVVEDEWGKTIAETIAQPDFYAYLNRIEKNPPGLQEIFASRIF